MSLVREERKQEEKERRNPEALHECDERTTILTENLASFDTHGPLLLYIFELPCDDTRSGRLQGGTKPDCISCMSQCREAHHLRPKCGG